jgi:hypothetical protein
MEEKEEKNPEETKRDDTLPFCTHAPSAEHARATNEDEPCDDGRAGK